MMLVLEEMLLPDFVIGWKELGTVASMPALEAAQGAVAYLGMFCFV